MRVSMRIALEYVLLRGTVVTPLSEATTRRLLWTSASRIAMRGFWEHKDSVKGALGDVLITGGREARLRGNDPSVLILNPGRTDGKTRFQRKTRAGGAAFQGDTMEWVRCARPMIHRPLCRQDGRTTLQHLRHVGVERPQARRCSWRRRARTWAHDGPLRDDVHTPRSRPTEPGEQEENRARCATGAHFNSTRDGESHMLQNLLVLSSTTRNKTKYQFSNTVI